MVNFKTTGFALALIRIRDLHNAETFKQTLLTTESLRPVIPNHCATSQTVNVPRTITRCTVGNNPISVDRSENVLFVLTANNFSLLVTGEWIFFYQLNLKSNWIKYLQRSFSDAGLTKSN